MEYTELGNNFDEAARIAHKITEQHRRGLKILEGLERTTKDAARALKSPPNHQKRQLESVVKRTSELPSELEKLSQASAEESRQMSELMNTLRKITGKNQEGQ